jgi:fluoroacetyl-CoA thioesterase
MKKSLKVGLRYEHIFVLPNNKTVPDLYPESSDFALMPRVFATGFMVGFCEWACILCIKNHLDKGEVSLGTYIDLSHQAASPMGATVRAVVSLTKIQDKKLDFKIVAYDNFDMISEGSTQRVIVDRERFEQKIQEKREKLTIK